METENEEKIKMYTKKISQKYTKKEVFDVS